MSQYTPNSSANGAGHGGPRWIKSSFSYANGDCVEVASLPDGAIGVRDSKDASGPVLRFTASEWQAFISGACSGEFDQLSGS
jgi:hypothetical protein